MVRICTYSGSYRVIFSDSLRLLFMGCNHVCLQLVMWFRYKVEKNKGQDDSGIKN